MSDEAATTTVGERDPGVVDELDDIEDLDELEFLLEEIESKIAPLALTDLV